MSHQVLARKWRPRTFQTLIGQDHVVRALDHALNHDRLHHAYLFTGTRGVGKTTIARILAKAVNCERGVSATPCGECSACRSIDQGHFVDYLELDAASNRGVDEMAQLLDNAVYAPTAGRYKVYVIDEVHMLSAFAFNAMLKTLEEPPPHVLFILATTDPQKVPVTVLSRCMQFNLRNMRPDAIAGHLDMVLQAEGIRFERPALTLLGKAAAGSMRDALSLLDQAIAFGAGEVRQDQVAEMLGTVDSSHVERIFVALASGDTAALVAVADEVADQSKAADSLLAELAGAVTVMAMNDATGPTAAMADSGYPVHAFSPEDLQVFYQILLYGRRDLPLAPDLRAGLTMTLLRLAAFRIDEPRLAGGNPDAGTTRPSSGRAASPAAPPRRAAPDRIAGHVGESRYTSVAAAPGEPVSSETVSSRTASSETASSETVTVAPMQVEPVRSEPAPNAAAVTRRLSPVAAARAALAARAAEPSRMPPARAQRTHQQATPSKSTNPQTADRQAAAQQAAAQPATSQRSDPQVARSDAGTPGRGERPLPANRPDDSRFGPSDPEPPPAPFPVAEPANDDLSDEVEPPQQRSAMVQPFDGDWPALAEQLTLPGRAGQFLRQSQLLDFGPHEFSVRVPISPLADESVVARVRAALTDHFGVAIRLHASVGRIDGPTVVQLADAAKAADLARAEASLAADPFIQTLLDEFDAQILPGSIRAIAPNHDQGDNHA